jgi:organic hydroperoxide reductase OsmC/OhrA
MSGVHRYRTRCSWRGSTDGGYEVYSRAHEGFAIPAEVSLRLSSDPAFHGDATLLNPEQLVVLASSSCQLLAFLAVAATARIDVLEYEDDAEGEMPEDPRPMSIARITLRPRVVVAAGPTVERIEHLLDVAHHECFIANSLKTEILLEPEISFREPTP